jgi:acyl-coenzyme A synthetase/AMP-(fatty) acid ligase
LQQIGHEVVTRQQFHEKVTATVNLLKWKGVVPNDRVLVTITPSIEFYAIAIGVFALGGSLIIIDPSMGLERCNHCIATAKPSVWLWEKGSKFKFLKVSEWLHCEYLKIDI